MLNLSKKINYRELYKKHPSYLIKLYLFTIYRKRYLINFLADSIKVMAYWYYILISVTYMYTVWNAIKALYVLKILIFYSVPIWYLSCYYEVWLWRLPFIYAVDFYFLYFASRTTDYLEHLELLWVHRK